MERLDRSALAQMQEALSEIGLGSRFLDGHFQPIPDGIEHREAVNFAPKKRNPFIDILQLLPLFRLDVDGLEKSLNVLLSKNVRGFAYQLRRHGNIVKQNAEGYARTRIDGNRRWTTNTRLHVASVSKFVTAMVMLKVLEERGMSTGNTIGSWLPDYWNRGPNVSSLTFDTILRHTSGLFADLEDDNGPHTFAAGRVAIRNGAKASAIGMFKYRNVNFALCRILLATITGRVPTSFARFGSAPAMQITAFKDAVWDAATIDFYQQEVARLIFRPAGIPNRDFAQDNAGFAYKSANDAGPGWQSGDLAGKCGTMGWHFSVSEVAAIAGFFRRDERLMGNRKAQDMLDAEIGVDPGLRRDTPIGRVMGKGGLWPDNGRFEQACVFIIPQGYELAFAANSPRNEIESVVKDGTVAHLIADAIAANVVLRF